MNTVLVTEPWRLTDNALMPAHQMLKETLLSQGNGYIGSRGTLEEGGAHTSCEGVYLNGLYSSEAIVYGESAYGFAEHNHKMLQLPNGKIFRLSLQGEALLESPASTGDYQRSLDLRDGVLSRQQTLVSRAGQRIAYHSERIVCTAVPGLLLQRIRLKALHTAAEVLIETGLDADYQPVLKAGDPRIGKMSARHGLDPLLQHVSVDSTKPSAMLFKAHQAPFIVGAVLAVDWPAGATLLQEHHDDYQLTYTTRLQLEADQQVEILIWNYYGHQQLPAEGAQVAAGLNGPSAELVARLQAELQALRAQGVTSLWQAHQQQISQFWQTADVQLPADPALQQGMRFNLFSLYQSAGRNGMANIGAKGLTGPGYDGHYFWDTEIYVVPVLSLCQPETARALLQFRVNQLDAARSRAREMSHAQGALYPWRTIGGTECSAYFPAGTAQYHINAAIAYALRSYYLATDDFAFIAEEGAGMLFETARLWLELGFFNQSGAFEIHEVTGPDEYTALVNNNFYTNAMARMHLQFAVDIWHKLQRLLPKQWEHWKNSLGLTHSEVLKWQQAAKKMTLLYSDVLGIHAQDEQFLSRKKWDIASTPADKFPLLLHYHPLVIYRHQVLKQADVVMAMVLLDDAFSTEVKARNLAYYEPLTTHDSSLSTCIHSVACAETGDVDKALWFLRDTLRMDLDNRHHNTEFGVHIACMAGSWLAITSGFAGMRVRPQGLYFAPRLPSQWPELAFCLTYQGRQLRVCIYADQTEYSLEKGESLNLYHHGELVQLSRAIPQVTKGKGVSV